MHLYTYYFKSELIGHANEDKAIPMKAYMKHKFEFLGIPSPERRKVLKEYVKQNAIKDEHELEVVVKDLWELPEREFQYCAIEILMLYKKLWQPKIINVVERCVINKSWWDTVDPLSYDCAGNYFKMFPYDIKSITATWNNGGNMWLQRSSLLFQKSYKKDTDVLLLARYILNLAGSKEFFLQKAIGWVLREYARFNPAWVKKFVDDHKLSPLSVREAMKHL